MKVLLNGGAGFIGLALANKLKSMSIDALVFDTPRRIDRAKELFGHVRMIPCDFNSPPEPSLWQAEVLVHLAWSSQPANSMASMAEDALSNIVGSLNLFDRCARSGVKKIIFASSGGTVYGNVNHLPIAEDSMLAPVSAYGVSKLSVERYLQLLSFHHPVSGISLRIGNPFGPYQLQGTPIGLIANILLQLNKGDPIRIFGDGGIVRDYIWIDDLTEAFAKAIIHDINPGEYNIGSGCGCSINRIVDLVETAYGQHATRVYVEQRSFDVGRIVLSIDKFAKAVNWRPEVTIQDGIARMSKAAQEI